MLQTLAVQQFTNQKGALRIFLLFNFSLVLNYNDLREVPNEKKLFLLAFSALPKPEGEGGEPLYFEWVNFVMHYLGLMWKVRQKVRSFAKNSQNRQKPANKYVN